MKNLLAISLIGFFLFTACKKDPVEISLTGKWNVETVVTKEYENSALINTNTEPGMVTNMTFKPMATC